ncbi:peptide/nickel transport system permease protein/glutathione transport system permease protein [Sphingomonas sp. YR710]|uniref:ABC transporter permease n=1 Tax=Sphingomonas sp. YR710 TaxID=1882773 RepID=UPI00087ED983|nr:ABC transporter permease [Sphingomonas sp. YR710]SDD48415.1 peptide/nickel transport system permease protein/glutathione transport system permease protein [Sphingomonas sp. YR710]
MSRRKTFLAHPGATIGGAMLAIIFAAAALAPWAAPYDWNAIGIAPSLSSPSANCWFGTDLYGRDIFSRVIAGGRYSIAIGMMTLALSMSLGSLIGMVLGYSGGRVDAWGSRAIDVLLGLPALVVAIMIVSVLGVGLVNVAIAVALAQAPHYARIIRSATIMLRRTLFIDAARAIGAGPLSITLRHLLPNVAPTLIVVATLNLGEAILATSTLSFLGLGAQPPTPEWGAMLADGQAYMRYAPGLMIFPGLAIFLTVIAVNLLGNRLSQTLNPRSKGH